MPLKILSFTEYRKLNEDEIPAAGAAIPSTPTAGAGSTLPTGAVDPTTAVLNSPTLGMGSSPTSLGFPDPTGMGGAAVPPPVVEEVPTYKMVFLDDNVDWHIQKPDGGGTKKYMEYQIEDPALDTWLQEKGWTEDKPEFQKMLKGEKYSLDSSKVATLRHDFENESLGDEAGEIEVDYDEKNEPFVSDIDVVFISAANHSETK